MTKGAVYIEHWIRFFLKTNVTTGWLQLLCKHTHFQIQEMQGRTSTSTCTLWERKRSQTARQRFKRNWMCIYSVSMYVLLHVCVHTAVHLASVSQKTGKYQYHTSWTTHNNHWNEHRPGINQCNQECRLSDHESERRLHLEVGWQWTTVIQ